ncbi:hypothetical protein [Aureimonas sp. ME7]|uniref:hypothetical protein n=1 Tax=Aureimonas sp. ME7 TaxID=2744252 RepID=UPI0015F40CFE|nr:hypothetical protein [Aureimonas sp. ME7]
MARDAAGTARFVVVEAIAVLAGAIIGLLVAAVFGWLFLSVIFGSIAAAPGYYILALVTVLVFAVLYHRLPGTPAALASLAVGILLPTVIARFAFDRVEPLGSLVLLHLVFALVALSVYRFVHASGLVQRAADNVTDRP